MEKKWKSHKGELVKRRGQNVPREWPRVTAKVTQKTRSSREWLWAKPAASLGLEMIPANGIPRVFPVTSDLRNPGGARPGAGVDTATTLKAAAFPSSLHPGRSSALQGCLCLWKVSLALSVSSRCVDGLSPFRASIRE